MNEELRIDALRRLLALIAAEADAIAPELAPRRLQLLREAMDEGVSDAAMLDGLVRLLGADVEARAPALQALRAARRRVRELHARLLDDAGTPDPAALREALRAERVAVEELLLLDRRAARTWQAQSGARDALRRAWHAARERARRLHAPLSLALLDWQSLAPLESWPSARPGEGAQAMLVRLMRARLRPGDHVAGWGGSAFVLLLPQADGPVAQEVVRRLQRELARDLCLNEAMQALPGLRVGLVQASGVESLEALLARAEQVAQSSSPLRMQ